MSYRNLEIFLQGLERCKREKIARQIKVSRSQQDKTKGKVRYKKMLKK